VTQLAAGEQAPDFELRDAEGNVWRLSALAGHKVIVYFYPADDTPGCTAEARDFRDSKSELRDAGYIVLGVSPQSAESHRAFAAKLSLDFPLLIDDDLEVARRYGAVRDQRGFHGSIPLDVQRSTFVVDEHGTLTQALYGFEGRGHVAQLRELLQV
jgi:thioredoxin-dependent peroxiredoxin